MTDQFDSPYHAPVMVEQCLSLILGDRPPAAASANVLDGTLGGGGHSAAFLAAGAQVSALDQDAAAISEAAARLADAAGAGRFRAYECNFADVGSVEALSAERFDGILLDLGVSSRQLDNDARGFTFREGAKLDMRMAASGNSSGRTAAELLNAAGRDELRTIFREYGDDRQAGRLANAVVKRRERAPFATSDDLVGAIRSVYGPRSGPAEFARLFQAVRIAVNDEFGVLSRALPDLRDRLAPSGVIVVITYHSGEDRLVKHAFRDWSIACICPPRQPRCVCGGSHALGTVLTPKALTADESEVARNPRARSAHLRAWRRRAEAAATLAWAAPGSPLGAPPLRGA